MAFVLPGDYPDNDLPAFRQAWDTYTAYLSAHVADIPSATYSFATASWHYDPTDPRCPHDSWVEALTILELAQGERHHNRSLTITIRLLGAYHNGIIQLSYPVVYAYSLSKPQGVNAPVKHVAHDDWLVDEIRLADNKHILHEIVFASQARWVIECAEIQHEWLPSGSLI